MEKFEIIIYQKAFSSITECVMFLNNVSNDAAKHLYEEFISSIKSLEDMPNRYPVINDIKIKESAVRKMPIHKGQYLIIYKVELNKVYIYDILDVRKDNDIIKYI